MSLRSHLLNRPSFANNLYGIMRLKPGLFWQILLLLIVSIVLFVCVPCGVKTGLQLKFVKNMVLTAYQYSTVFCTPTHMRICTGRLKVDWILLIYWQTIKCRHILWQRSGPCRYITVHWVTYSNIATLYMNSRYINDTLLWTLINWPVLLTMFDDQIY